MLYVMALSAGEAANPTGVKMIIAAIGAILVTWFIVAKGPTSIKFFNMVVSPALVILMLVMLYLILSHRSFGELLAMPALAPPFEEFEQEARLSIDSYERAVSDDRPGATAATEGNDVLHFLRWMAGLGHLELCGEPRELDDALLGDPGEFYEVLLEHPLVEEVFLTKSEFSQSLRDWRSLQGPEAL